MKRSLRVLTLVCLASLLATASCKSKEIVVLHLETRSGSLLYWDRGVVTFTPVDGTSFRKNTQGSWAGGAVTYSVNDAGEFVIEMDGAWMQEQAQENMERFGGSFVVEVPLTNVEGKGSFELVAQYLYNDEDDGTGWRATHEGRLFGTLELPFNPATGDKISLLMQCVDEQREACTPSGWDPDTTEIADVPDVAEGEDVSDVSTDEDVSDITPDPVDATDVPDTPDVDDPGEEDVPADLVVDVVEETGPADAMDEDGGTG